MSRWLVTLSVTSLCATVAAQDLSQQPPLASPSRSPILAGAVAPDGEQSGTWASGEAYKVHFAADGATFYPYVGRSLPHQPFAWRTASVTVGGVELLDGRAPRLTAAGYDADYDRGAVHEHYEVRAEGLEQTFVIAARPTVTGELVVTGDVATPLQLVAQEARHGALSLSLADGREVLRYGAAVAIDAAGRRTPMTTAVLDGRIELRLAAEAVTDASFPLTIDPLIEIGQLSTGTDIDGLDVLQEDVAGSAANGELWVVEAREVAAGDRDVRLYRYGADFAGPAAEVYREISLWDSSHPQLALAATSAKVVCVHHAIYPGGGLVMVHRHDVASMAFQSSSANSFVPTATGESIWRPDVGGRRNLAGNRVLIVYQLERVTPFAETDVSEVWGTVFDATTGAYVVAPFAIRAVQDFDVERPAVSQASGNHTWLVAWQEIHDAVINDDWEVLVRGVDGNGAIGGVVGTAEGQDQSLHCLSPQVAGGGSRYLLSYVTRPFSQTQPRPTNGLGLTSMAQRIEYDFAAMSGSRSGPAVELRVATQNFLLPGSCAFDYYTTDHWCVTLVDMAWGKFHAYKLGFRGEPVETFRYDLTLPDYPAAMAVTFDQAREFPMVRGVTAYSGSGPDRVHGSKVTYDPVDAPSLLGGACGTGHWANLAGIARNQQIGAQGMPLQLVGAPQDLVAVALISTGEFMLPAGPLGAPGCVLWPDLSAPAYVGSINCTIVGGVASTSLNLPESLPPMTLTMQWLYLVVGANPLNLLASEGLRVELGR